MGYLFHNDRQRAAPWQWPLGGVPPEEPPAEAPAEGAQLLPAQIHYEQRPRQRWSHGTQATIVPTRANISWAQRNGHRLARAGTSAYWVSLSPQIEEAAAESPAEGLTQSPQNRRDQRATPAAYSITQYPVIEAESLAEGLTQSPQYRRDHRAATSAYWVQAQAPVENVDPDIPLYQHLPAKVPQPQRATHEAYWITRNIQPQEVPGSSVAKSFRAMTEGLRAGSAAYWLHPQVPPEDAVADEPFASILFPDQAKDEQRAAQSSYWLHNQVPPADAVVDLPPPALLPDRIDRFRANPSAYWVHGEIPPPDEPPLGQSIALPARPQPNRAAYDIGGGIAADEIHEPFGKLLPEKNQPTNRITQWTNVGPPPDEHLPPGAIVYPNRINRYPGPKQAVFGRIFDPVLVGPIATSEPGDLLGVRAAPMVISGVQAYPKALEGVETQPKGLRGIK